MGSEGAEADAASAINEFYYDDCRFDRVPSSSHAVVRRQKLNAPCNDAIVGIWQVIKLCSFGSCKHEIRNVRTLCIADESSTSNIDDMTSSRYRRNIDAVDAFLHKSSANQMSMGARVCWFWHFASIECQRSAECGYATGTYSGVSQRRSQIKLCATKEAVLGK